MATASRTKKAAALPPSSVDPLDAKLDKVMGTASPFAPVRYWISTGIEPLDWSIGGGLPCGKITEVFGDESTFKSGLALSAARWVQAQGGLVFYIDAENGLTYEWVQKLGVKMDNPNLWRYRRPFYIEQACNGLEVMCIERAGADTPTLIIWDSLAGGVAKVNSMEEKTMGEHPKVASRSSLLTNLFERGFHNVISNSKVAVLFLNQQRSAINSKHPGSTNTPGGRSVKFWAAVRVKVDDHPKKGDIGQEGQPPIGKWIAVKVVKNKVDAPGRRCIFPVFFNHGADNGLALVEYLVDQKVLQYVNGRVYYGGRSMFRHQLRDLMLQDPGIYNEIREASRQAYYGEKVT